MKKSLLILILSFFLPSVLSANILSGPSCVQQLEVTIQTHDQRFRDTGKSVREFLRGIPDADFQEILNLESQVRVQFKALRKVMQADPEFWEIRKGIVDAHLSKILVAQQNASVTEPLRKRNEESVLEIAKMEFKKGVLVRKNFLPPGAVFDSAPFSFLKNADLTDFWKKRISQFDNGQEAFSYSRASWQVSLWRQPESVEQAESWVVYRVLMAGPTDELWEYPPLSVDNGSSTLFFQPPGGVLHPMPAGPGGENVTYNSQNSRAIGEIEVAHIAYQYDTAHGTADWKGLMDTTYSRMIGGQLPPSCWKTLKYDAKLGQFAGRELEEFLPADQRRRFTGPDGNTPVRNSRVISLEP